MTASTRVFNSFRCGNRNVLAGSVIPDGPEQSDTIAAYMAVGGYALPIDDILAAPLDNKLANGADEFELSALMQALYLAYDYLGTHTDGYLLNVIRLGGVAYFPGTLIEPGDPTGLGAQLSAAGGFLLPVAFFGDPFNTAFAARMAALHERGANEREFNSLAMSLIFGFFVGGWPSSVPTTSIGYVMKTIYVDGVLFTAGDVVDSSIVDLTNFYAAGGSITGFTDPTTTATFQKVRGNGADSETMDAMVLAFLLWWFD